MTTTTKDKSKTSSRPRGTRAAAPRDPWENWQPEWTRRKKNRKEKTDPSVHDHQEKHSPTTAFFLRGHDGKDTVAGRRRLTDARLWDAMTDAEQAAATEIAEAFEMLGRGMGYASPDWQRVRVSGGKGNIAAAHGRLADTYIDWTKACHKEGISHSMIIDILVYGFTCAALDRDRRVRTGYSRHNLLAGLALYAALRRE